MQEQFGIERIFSRAQFYNLVASVDAKAFRLLFTDWMRSVLRGGVKGKTVSIDGKTICGTDKLTKDGSVLHIASAIGIVALSDTLRGTAKTMVQELRNTHTDIVLLTGDHEQTAKYFAEQAGIQNIYAELLPAQKAEQIQALQKQGRNLWHDSDGVNDAPALKTAFVGVQSDHWCVGA